MDYYDDIPVKKPCCLPVLTSTFRKEIFSDSQEGGTPEPHVSTNLNRRASTQLKQTFVLFQCSLSFIRLVDNDKRVNVVLDE